MLKSFLKRVGIGFLLGIPIGSMIAWFSSGNLVSAELVRRLGDRTLALILQFLCSGLYGAMTMGGTVLYDLERCPLALATGLHCLIVVLPYIPFALLLCWADNFSDILIAECFQITAFFIIWLIMYLGYKADVRKLNELNQSRNQQQNQKGANTP